MVAQLAQWKVCRLASVLVRAALAAAQLVAWRGMQVHLHRGALVRRPGGQEGLRATLPQRLLHLASTDLPASR